MREIRTEIDLDAPPERVWQVLTDFPAYAAWNPFLPHLAGDVEVGAPLVVTTQPPGRPANTVNARMLIAKAFSHLRWEGVFVNRLLFSGTHIYELEPRGTGTRFVNREEFRGVLAPLLLAVLGPNLPNGYRAMNVALRARLDGVAAEPEPAPAPDRVEMNGYLKWWQRVLAFGLLVNFVSGFAAFFVPQRVQRAMRLEPLAGTAWLRLAGLMLVNVSIYGLGTLRDPAKHPVNAHLASWERLGSGLFSLQVATKNPLQSATRPKAFLPLGLFDTTVSITGIVLLTLGLRKQRRG